MVFTVGERRLLAFLVLFLGIGYLLTGLRQCGELAPARGTGGIAAAGDSGVCTETLDSAATGPDRTDALAVDRFVDGYLDLNAADSLALLSLPGIGPAFAGRILTVRRQRGTFSCVDDLLEVKGIGPKRLARLRSFVTVRPAAPSSLPPPG